MTDKESLEDRKQIIVNSISPWMPQSPHERKPALEALASICEEVDELKAELDQCLTAHAILNDKVCALEQAIQNTLDTGMDRYIREAIACPECPAASD